MKIRKTGLGAFLAILLLGAGCQREADTNAAIQKAIEEHLASRPGLASADIVLDVQQVKVAGEQAEAEVVFRSRTDPDVRMAFHYNLNKEGRQWKVAGGRPSAETSPHPGAETMPEGDLALPEGHPPLGETPPPPPSDK